MSSDDRRFERLDSRTVFDGRIVEVTVDTFRYADDQTAEREIVRTSDAAAVVAIDGEHVWLVRQPREPVDDPDSLELPAGRIDGEGEDALRSAQRELAEEIGLTAQRWPPLKAYRSSVGFTDEVVHVFLAEGLAEAEGDHDSGEDERIEIVRWPLADLDGAIAEVSDSKTLIGLLLLERHRRA